MAGLNHEALRAVAEENVCGYIDVFGVRHNPLLHGWETDPLARTDQERDLRTVWEIGRFHWLHALAVAYDLTGDPRYLGSAESLTISFMASTRHSKSLQWNCAMEAAIRTINIIESRERFGSNIPISLSACLSRLIYAGRETILLGLEWNFQRGNHYLANLIGLFAIEEVLPGRLARFRSRFLWTMVERELKQQLDPTGDLREGSIAYLGLILELAALAAVIGWRRGHEFSEEVTQVVRTNIEALDIACQVGGTAPPKIGDDDSGRVFRRGTESDEWSLLVAFLRASFGVGAASAAGSKCRMVQTDGYSMFLRPSSWSGFLRASHYPLHVRAHRHADVLQVFASLDGVPILVDPGNPRYSGNRAVSSTAVSWEAHNGPIVCRSDLRLLEGGVLAVPVLNGGAAGASAIGVGGARLVAGRRAEAGVVRRGVQIGSSALEVNDELDLPTACHVVWHWSFGPEVRVIEINPAWFVVRSPVGEIRGTIGFSRVIPSLTLGQYEYYPAYGRTDLCERLVLEGDLPCGRSSVRLVLARY